MNYSRSAYICSIIGPLGCTSIVAENEDGIILHGRNLDYEMTPLLRNGTLIAEFTRDDKVIYTAVTFFLYVGVLTGQRPNAFAITLNSRNSGGYIDNILMEIITRFRHPISFSIRKVAIICPSSHLLWLSLHVTF
uniref:Acid ceramidase N-terminal domain-containing protein n=1 Tax=Parascaris univalens TaxID=6257 RepID=A0A915CCC7_PARUN